MKILVIKLGYSETLDSEIGKIPSLGDVLRTTPILSALKDKYPYSDITWLVAEEAHPLLTNNEYLDRILIWDNFVPFQLLKERFDILINLEKIPGVCAIADMVDAWVKYGFRFDSQTGTYSAYEKGLDFLNYIQNKNSEKKTNDYWQKVLIEMIGETWTGQEYILGYKPKTTATYDIGLNYKSGSKWLTKAMPMEKWNELESLLLRENYKISWQEGLNDLYEYIDWLNSCRCIITQDSLGLHIAIALKKKVIGIFGPTSFKEVYPYNRCQFILPKVNCKYMPCYESICKNDKFCMDYINLNEIISKVNMNS
jgi:heptosyltransferase-2